MELGINLVISSDFLLLDLFWFMSGLWALVALVCFLWLVRPQRVRCHCFCGMCLLRGFATFVFCCV